MIAFLAIDNLADAFANELRNSMTPEKFQRMMAKNVGLRGTGICASHDFCDANIAMDDAWQKVLGFSPIECEDQADQIYWIDIWRTAWDYAMEKHLTKFLYHEYFPDFPADEYPICPELFFDSSWGNDCCPSMRHNDNGLVIWVDWPNAEDREISDGERFGLCLEDDATGDTEDLLWSDSWDEILSAVHKFNGAKAVAA